MRIGILGVSNRSVSLLKMLAKTKLIEFSGVYDYDIEQAQLLAEKLETSHNSNPFGLIVKSDLLIIPKTDEESFNLIEECVLNSKHVIVEKPLNLTISEVEKVNKLSHEAGVSVVPYLPYRFSNCVLNTKSYIFNPGFLNINYSCTPEFRSCNASKLELLLNLIDIAVNLLKANVKKTAVNSVNIVGNSPNAISLRLDFDNGATANLFLDLLSSQDNLQVSVFQSNQIVSIDLTRNFSIIKNFNKGNLLDYEVTKPVISKDENPYEEIISYIETFEAFRTTVSVLDSFMHSLIALRKVEERYFQQL